jgi:hypothetical protein
MATDPHGNVYVLSYVYESVAGPYTFNVAGHTQNAYGLQDISVTSFSCNGVYRWSKTFGAKGSDFASSIKADSLGGVYIAGSIISFGQMGPGHFDTDTSVWTDRTFFIIKYDTAGNYQWLRMPEDNPTPFASSYTTPLDMDADGAGNLHILCSLYPGSYLNGSLVTTDTGYYLLRYNSGGVFQSVVPMQIKTSPYTYYLHMKADFTLGRYYVTGYGLAGNLYFNNIPITNPLFVGAFDSQGNYLWHRMNGPHNSSQFFRPSIDDQHNIYLAGNSSHNDTFNNYMVVNTVTTLTHSLPLVVKLDTNGNNLWAINGSVNAASGVTAVTVRGNEVFVGGTYPGKLVFAGYDSLQHVINQGYDVFLLRLNAATGSVIGLDSIGSSFGFTEFPSAIAADNKNNVYVGGFFENNMEIGNDTIVKSGGPGDFFVAKFGFDNCNCVSTPTASFSYTGVNPLVFSFTGTQPADSIVWNFGDGSHATGPTASHSYANDGSYQACATVYSPCGIDSSCQTIIITDIASLSRDGYGMKVYPNPAQQSTRIDYSLSDNEAGVIEVYDMVGRKMAQHQLSNNRGSWQLSLEGYSAGLYMVVLKEKGMVVKQTTLSVVR